MQSPASARGFTLIELMVVTAIIGILSTVAIPGFKLMNERSKAAERAAIVRSVRNSLNTYRMREGTFGAGGLTGDWNPHLPLLTTKRPFLPADPGWRELDLTIDGDCFYSYHFTGQEGAVPFFTVTAWGDLDGNGDEYFVAQRYELNGAAAAFIPVAPFPDPMYEATVF